MTANKLRELTDHKDGMLLTRDGLTVRVRILDARVTFGATHILVTPQDGSGEVWVDRLRVKLGGV